MEEWFMNMNMLMFAGSEGIVLYGIVGRGWGTPNNIILRRRGCLVYTLKTSESNFQTERVHLCKTPFQVNDMTQKSVILTRNVTQSWVNLTPHYWSSLLKADRFLGHRWPGVKFSPIGPFPDHANPGVFKVYVLLS